MRKFPFLTILMTALLGSGLLVACGGGGGESSAGTWTDLATNLIWQNPPSASRMDLNSATTYCTALRLGDHRDWRLPTIGELRSLIRGCPNTVTDGACGVTDSCLTFSSCWSESCGGCTDRAGPGLDGAYWPNGISGGTTSYWSSSAATGSSSFVYVISFGSGLLDKTGDGGNYYVRCVRQ